MRIKKVLKRLFPIDALSWSDKKHYSNYVFENFVGNKEKKDVSEIFYLDSYRADGTYLDRFKPITIKC